MEPQETKLSILFHHASSILWLEMTGATASRVCALPKQLDFLLSEDIWQEEIPYILTSGTISVGGDFSHFKRNSGIILAEKRRIFETSKASPFDYPNHALLYLPQDMPLPSDKDSSYFQAVVNRLVELIESTHGHTLILFTSYRMMEQAYDELCRRITSFPLFRMAKAVWMPSTLFVKAETVSSVPATAPGRALTLPGIFYLPSLWYGCHFGS